MVGICIFLAISDVCTKVSLVAMKVTFINTYDLTKLYNIFYSKKFLQLHFTHSLKLDAARNARDVTILQRRIFLLF